MAWNCCCNTIDASFGFLTQAAWFVDSVNGNDANNGLTAATAIRSMPELARRLNGRTFQPGLGGVTVDLVGDFPGQFLDADIDLSNQRIDFVAHPTTVLAGAITLYTPPAAPAQDAQLNAGGAFVWAGSEQRRVRITSGPFAGAVSWVMKDLGGGQARVSGFVMPTTLLSVNPGVGETFVVETLGTRLAGFSVRIMNGTGYIFNVAFEADAPSVTARNSSAQNDGFIGNFSLFGCRFQTQNFTFTGWSSVQVIGCSNASTSILSSGFGTLGVRAHCAFNSLLANVGRVIFSVSPSFFQNALLNSTLGSFLSIQALLGSFDRVGAGANNILVAVGCVLETTAAIYGIGNLNTGVAVATRSSSQFVWSAGNQPTITAVGGDLSIGGAAATTWAIVAAAPQSAVQNANNGAGAGLRS